MKPENKKYLDDHRADYDLIMAQDYIPRRVMDMPAKIYEIIRQEFNPNYFNDLDCPTCVFSIIRDGYRLYDSWIKVQPKELPRVVQDEPLVVATGFPKDEKPISRSFERVDSASSSNPNIPTATLQARAEKRMAQSLKRHRK